MMTLLIMVYAAVMFFYVLRTVVNQYLRVGATVLSTALVAMAVSMSGPWMLLPMIASLAPLLFCVMADDYLNYDAYLQRREKYSGD